MRNEELSYQMLSTIHIGKNVVKNILSYRPNPKQSIGLDPADFGHNFCLLFLFAFVIPAYAICGFYSIPPRYIQN